ncbi:MAG: GT4 family glycosyltransferase PelF [Propionibacteriaceae bacterium]|nr:GT4 family glycosyltransferase PelF [Propionibacteriaceae bacterium]
MRIALVNEGTYPVTTGGVSTWCHRLVETLFEHEFHVVTLVGLERENLWPSLGNIGSVTMVPLWDPPAFGRTTGGQRREVSDALRLLWRAVLPADREEANVDLLRVALKQIVDSGHARLSTVFDRVTSTRAILEAWAGHARAHPELPALPAGVAAEVARHADRVLAVMDAEIPEVDLITATANGPASVLSLVRFWRRGTPVVLAEHGIYLRERYLALGAAGWPWLTRYVMMAFLRGISQLVYADASALAPVSEFNARWEVKLGADPGNIVPIPNAIDHAEFPLVTWEPPVPTVSFVGRIDPLKDLDNLIVAFSYVRQVVPDAVLRLFGPTPQGNEQYRERLEARTRALGLDGVVTFEGPCKGPQPAILAGHVVALSSISEGMPFSVIEAMMSGRATVSTDVGGVAECVGRDGKYGIVVPARDPKAFADALIWLLTEHQARREMGRAARERALDKYSIDVFRHRYQTLYDCLGPRRSAPGEPTRREPSFPRRAALMEKML